MDEERYIMEYYPARARSWFIEYLVVGRMPEDLFVMMKDHQEVARREEEEGL